VEQSQWIEGDSASDLRAAKRQLQTVQRSAKRKRFYEYARRARAERKTREA